MSNSGGGTGKWVPVNGNGPSIPDDQFHSDEEKQQERYGTPSQQGLAAIESTARGLTFGGSDWLLTHTGTPAEAIRGRQEANPAISAIGNIAGSIRTLGLAPIGAATEAGLAGTMGMAPTAARALGYGLEGAAIGAGNAISDANLTDGPLNAQKIFTDIGAGALFGAGIGLFSKGLEAVPSLFRKSAVQAAESAEPEAIATSLESEPIIKDATEAKSGISPTSLEDMQKRVKESSYSGESTELPAKSVLADASGRVSLMNPVHPLQVESLGSQSARDLYKTALEMPGKEGDTLRSYEALQKNELTGQTKNVIKNISPEMEITGDAVKGGESAIKSFTEEYKSEKDLLGPAFKQLKEYETEDPFNHAPQVISKMTDAVPGVARMFDTSGDEIALKKYSPAFGIDKATYTAVKDTVEALKEPAFVEDLMNIRKGLDQHVDVMAQGQAPQEIRALKAAMMDYIQGEVEKVDPLIKLASSEGEQGASIRDVFKRYAINEQERQVVEKAFGASVGSPEFGAISKVKPEEVLDRVFRNTATVDAAKNILPKEKFDHMLANWMSEQIEKVTDKGSFSSNKFGTFLKRNQDVLKSAFSDKPQALQQLIDLNNISRILPDSVSINPSGTAKTLFGILNAHSIGEFLGNIKGYAAEKIKHEAMIGELNEKLAGRADQATKMGIIRKTIQRTSDKIEDGVKNIFTSPAGRSGSIAIPTNISNKEYNERVNRIKELSNNPGAMIDHMSDSTQGMFAAAPNMTQSLHNTMVASLNFLNSKIPQPMNNMPLSAEYVPSQAQKNKFMTYFNAVNEPLTALKAVKNGGLTGETMEALQTVHPELLQEMRQKVMENLDPEKAMKLDYARKVSLAKFLGEPLDENMLPQSVMSYQSAYVIQQQQKNQGSGKSTQGGLKQLDLSGLAATHTQGLQSDKES